MRRRMEKKTWFKMRVIVSHLTLLVMGKLFISEPTIKKIQENTTQA